MTVYFDGVHLAGTDLDELHSIAQRHGLKREWFQDHSNFPHYDVFSSNIQASLLTDRVHLVTKRELVQFIRHKVNSDER